VILRVWRAKINPDRLEEYRRFEAKPAPTGCSTVAVNRPGALTGLS